jgi:hypothetical protein
MKSSWYLTTGICSLPGVLLAVSAYSLESPTGCAGDERFPELGGFLLSLLIVASLVSREHWDVIYYSLFAFDGLAGAVLKYGTFVTGILVLALAGAKTKEVSPIGLELLAFSVGLYLLQNTLSRGTSFCGCG